MERDEGPRQGERSSGERRERETGQGDHAERHGRKTKKTGEGKRQKRGTAERDEGEGQGRETGQGDHAERQGRKTRKTGEGERQKRGTAERDEEEGQGRETRERAKKRDDGGGKEERRGRGTARETNERDKGEGQGRETMERGKEERQWERDSEESHQETPHPHFLAPPHTFYLSITVLPQIHLNVEVLLAYLYMLVARQESAVLKVFVSPDLSETYMDVFPVYSYW